MAKVDKRTGAVSTGNFTPWIHHLPLIDSYYAAKPDAKIILLLRNPVDRAYSQYRWDLATGGKRLMKPPHFASYSDFVTTALDIFPSLASSAASFPLLQSGIYVDSVQRWLSLFGRDHVHVLTAEEYFSNTAESIRTVYEFLELPRVDPIARAVVNENTVDGIPREDDKSRQRLAEFYQPWNQRLYDVVGRDLGWDRTT